MILVVRYSQLTNTGYEFAVTFFPHAESLSPPGLFDVISTAASFETSNEEILRKIIIFLQD
jgi:hypothetical protein